MPRPIRKNKSSRQANPARKASSQPYKEPLAAGSKIPRFSLPATGGVISSRDLQGAPFVLYFYPKDNTSGCTAEACDFRDNIAVFNRLGSKVIGISKDSLESHEKFKKKYNLTFALASDAESDVCERFGVWVKKSMYGRSYMGIERSTFLVDGKGVIRALWRKVSVPGHIEEIKKALAAL